MRHRSLVPVAIVLVAFAGAAAYCAERPNLPLTDTLGQSACASPINECIKGTVNYNPIEGGCWLIHGDDGKDYQPVGSLAEEFRKDGLRVSLVFRRRNDVAGFCPGQFVDVVSLSKLP